MDDRTPVDPEGVPRRSLERIVAIDMLRGYAIIGIVLFHLWLDVRYVPPRPGTF